MKLILPRGRQEWENVAALYNLGRETKKHKDGRALKEKYRKIKKIRKGTGETELPELVVIARRIQKLINGKAGVTTMGDDDSDEESDDDEVEISLTGQIFGDSVDPEIGFSSNSSSSSSSNSPDSTPIKSNAGGRKLRMDEQIGILTQFMMTKSQPQKAVVQEPDEMVQMKLMMLQTQQMLKALTESVVAIRDQKKDE